MNILTVALAFGFLALLNVTSLSAEPSAYEMKRREQWAQLQKNAEKIRREEDSARDGALVLQKYRSEANLNSSTNEPKRAATQSEEALGKLDQLIAETPELPIINGKVLQVIDRKIMLIKVADSDPDQSIVALTVMDTKNYVDGDRVALKAKPVEPFTYISVTGAKRKVKSFESVE